MVSGVTARLLGFRCLAAPGLAFGIVSEFFVWLS